jgi:molybdenum ABC transporter molybdate-binding protein
LFLPADEDFIAMARARGLTAEELPLASMQAVVAVPHGNPRQIATLKNLTQPGLRLVQADPELTAIGRVTRETLQSSHHWESIRTATMAFRPTVTEVANDVVAGAADAGVVYDALLHGYPSLSAVTLDELAAARSRVTVAVLKGSKQPQAALHFARYIAAGDRGLKWLREQGYQTLSGDAWSDVPELSVYAGSMLRPAIEDTLQQFEQREGVRITRVYNGCGILVAQMKSGHVPDVYFACDTSFMKEVADLFPVSADVSGNELVILVPKGNPQQIASLSDLTQPGLRVGIGHEKQCAMGWLTQNTLREGGLQQEVMQNVTVQTPTGDMLVNQMRTGSLDAAVVYLSNAAGAGDVLDAVRIQGLACATAIQPVASWSSSRFPQLTARLLQALQSDESREIFEAEGFRWQAKP